MFFLEDHVVWEFSFAKTESSPHVGLQELAIAVLLDGVHDLLVKGGLVGLALLGGLVFLLFGLEDITLLLGLGVLLGGALEVSIIDVGGDLDSGDVDLGLSGQQVTLVDAPDWAAIQGIRT